VPPDTIKKVAATKGQSVRRTDFFREGTAKGFDAEWVGALAVANFYVFPLWVESLSATFACKSFPVFSIPEITLELVRIHEITGNFHRCKNIFVKFCQRGQYGGNDAGRVSTAEFAENAERSESWERKFNQPRRITKIRYLDFLGDPSCPWWL
jgi:hypothetical protein